MAVGSHWQEAFQCLLWRKQTPRIDIAGAGKCPEADPRSIKVGGELRLIGGAQTMVLSGYEANLCYLERSIGFSMHVTWI